jgi:uncharacterized protein
LIDGQWLGVISAGARQIRVGLSIEAVEGGGHKAMFRQIDPKVTVLDVPEFAYENGVVRFSMLRPNATYSGRVEGTPPSLVGVWTQQGREFPLTFSRVDAFPAARRPQEPVPPLPYAEEAVRIEGGSAGIVLAGTVTKPAVQGKHPAFLLISGSGVQDRDESAFGHRPFLVLADQLTRRGYVVLRLDDRGAGGSTGDVYETPLDDLAGDAIAAVNFLQEHADVDIKRIGLIGHSEGGLVAGIVAARLPDIACIITLGTPAVPMREVRAMLTESIGRSLGASDAAIEAIRAFNAAAFDAVEKGQQGEQLRQTLDALGVTLLESLPKDEQTHYKDLVRDLVASGNGYATKWFRSLLSHDAAATLAEARCPVLAIIGEKDMQVAAEPNIRAVEQVFVRSGNARSKAMILPSINHMLQTCRTGAIGEYAMIDETIAPAVIEAIASWHKSIE